MGFRVQWSGFRFFTLSPITMEGDLDERVWKNKRRTLTLQGCLAHKKQRQPRALQ